MLAAVLKFHFQQFSQSIKKDSSFLKSLEILKQSFYVDNCLTSLDSALEVTNFIDDAKLILKDAQFELRGWVTSVPEVSEVEEKIIGVLGLLWNREEDTLKVNVKFLKSLNIERVTKRIVLSVAHKLFDVIGITAPISIYPKQIIQRSWIDKVGWDEELDQSIKTQFLKWVKDLKYLSDLQIPRWVIGSEGYITASLHIFCDASSDAYAAVVYLRVETEDKVLINLVAARAKILPLKPQCTIPRAELLAATIAARLYGTLTEEESGLRKFDTYFWSDSSTVLTWIKRDENWSVFVANRVNEIKHLTNKNCWRHVPGNLNPADLASRGCSAKKLLETKWWEGPIWLTGLPDTWPSCEYHHDASEVNSEKKKGIVSALVSQCVTDPVFINNLLYFSNFNKIVNVIMIF